MPSTATDALDQFVLMESMITFSGGGDRPERVKPIVSHHDSKNATKTKDIDTERKLGSIRNRVAGGSDLFFFFTF